MYYIVKIFPKEGITKLPISTSFSTVPLNFLIYYKSFQSWSSPPVTCYKIYCSGGGMAVTQICHHRSGTSPTNHGKSYGIQTYLSSEATSPSSHFSPPSFLVNKLDPLSVHGVHPSLTHCNQLSHQPAEGWEVSHPLPPTHLGPTETSGGGTQLPLGSCTAFYLSYYTCHQARV